VLVPGGHISLCIDRRLMGPPPNMRLELAARRSKIGVVKSNHGGAAQP
jgi:hypothetical protein